MPFDANVCVSTLMNVTFLEKMLIESDKRVNECLLNKMNVFLVCMNECINEFEVGVNDSIFSGNEQQKV